jgi:hypothetical protein
MSITYQIHPSIGIARIGSSNEYFLGPEFGFPADFPPSEGIRDRQGAIRRQAARFRVFRVQRGAGGRVWAAEIKPSDVRIIWTVQLANRKAVGRRLENDDDQGEWRNKVKDPNDAIATKDLIIAPDPGEISLPPFPTEHVFEGGKFRGKEVTLGDMEVDEAGRLIVRGGWGNSGYTGSGSTADQLDFADNNDWYDDTSDGRVSARLEFTDGRKPVDAVPAWLLVGPPDFAPEIQNLVTLYDLALQMAICKGLREAPARPHFDHDIKPLLQRVFAYQWVNKQAAQRHGRGRPYDFEELAFWNRLGDPGADPGLRQRLFARLREPSSKDEKSGPTAMPRLHDDKGSFHKYSESRVFALLPFQYKMLRHWCEGDFLARGSPLADPPRFESLTDAIDRVAMEACVGGPFYPGIETWEIIREESLWAGSETDPFRLNYRDERLIPGRLTEGNALPWQSDFLDCAWEDGAGWWPAQRPDDVRVHPDSDEMAPWIRGLDQYAGRDEDLPANVVRAQDMIKHWDKLGYVIKAKDAHGNEVFVESVRDPNGVLGRNPGPHSP